MTFQVERRTLEQYFETNYTPPANTDVYYENVPDVRDVNPHIVMLVRTGTQNEASFGSTNVVFRNNGFMVFEVRGRRDEGNGPLLDIVDGISAIWRKQQIDNIRIQGDIIVDRIGERNGWFQMNLLVSFQRDEFI